MNNLELNYGELNTILRAFARLDELSIQEQKVIQKIYQWTMEHLTAEE